MPFKCTESWEGRKGQKWRLFWLRIRKWQESAGELLTNIYVILIISEQNPLSSEVFFFSGYLQTCINVGNINRLGFKILNRLIVSLQTMTLTGIFNPFPTELTWRYLRYTHANASGFRIRACIICCKHNILTSFFHIYCRHRNPCKLYDFDDYIKRFILYKQTMRRTRFFFMYIVFMISYQISCHCV